MSGGPAGEGMSPPVLTERAAGSKGQRKGTSPNTRKSQCSVKQSELGKLLIPSHPMPAKKNEAFSSFVV